jgi:hypothetical protein
MELDEEMAREREEALDEQRRFRRGLRLVRQGKASPEPQQAVNNYHKAVALRKKIEQERRELSKSTRQHVKDCRAAIAQLRRGNKAAEWVDVRINITPLSRRYLRARCQQIQAVRAIILACI